MMAKLDFSLLEIRALASDSELIDEISGSSNHFSARTETVCNYPYFKSCNKSDDLENILLLGLLQNHKNMYHPPLLIYN
jgi:hypothetical protein